MAVSLLSVQSALLYLPVFLLQGVAQPVLHHHEEDSLYWGGEEDEAGHGGLVGREGGLHRDLQCQGEHSQGKESQETSRDEDVDKDVREEDEIGHGQNTDDGSEAAELGQLHDLAGLLGEIAQEDRPGRPHQDDHSAGQAGLLVTVADTGGEQGLVSGRGGEEVRTFFYFLSHLHMICSILVARQDMKDMQPPRNMNMITKALLVNTSLIVPI